MRRAEKRGRTLSKTERTLIADVIFILQSAPQLKKKMKNCENPEMQKKIAAAIIVADCEVGIMAWLKSDADNWTE